MESIFWCGGRDEVAVVASGPKELSPILSVCSLRLLYRSYIQARRGVIEKMDTTQIRTSIRKRYLFTHWRGQFRDTENA